MSDFMPYRNNRSRYPLGRHRVGSDDQPARIYLCGPINGCSDAEARDWRERVKGSFGTHEWVEFLDPMRRDYRGRERECFTEIVEGDIADIRAADLLLVASPRPSRGTDMEIRLAKAELGKPIVVWSTETNPSPWLLYHADVIVSTLASAIIEVRSRIEIHTRPGEATR